MIEHNNPVYETQSIKVWLGEDGILRLISLPLKEISLAEAERNWMAVHQAGQGVIRPILADIRAIRGVSREARKFYASQPVKQVVNAVVLQIDSPFSKMVGSLFLGLYKPPVPIRLFDYMDGEALEWLKGFLN